MRFDHLASSTGVLAIGFIVKIAPADRRDVQKRCQRNQNNKKRMACRQPTNRRRLKESLFDPENAGTCDHRCVTLFLGHACPVNASVHRLPVSDIFPILYADGAVWPPASRSTRVIGGI